MEAAFTFEALATLLTYTPSKNWINIDNNNNSSDHDDDDDDDTEADNDSSLLRMSIYISMQYKFLYQ
jgi:hypothetical protein